MFRNLISIVASLVLVFGSAISGSASETEAIKVMSFNIRYGTARDGDNHWKNRHQIVLAAIKQEAPDLLGTQETLDFQAKYIQENFKEYASFGRSREEDPNRGEQCTIYYRKERFELLDQGQFWLSETPEKIASKSWDSSLPRIASWVKLRDRKSESEFVFMNTHFDHRGEQAREESAKLISKKIQAIELPVILTGDFNCGEKSKPYQALVGEGKKLVDTLREVQAKAGKDEGTFNGFRGDDNGARIDWILATRKWKIKAATICKYNDNGKYPSDHFPVTATLQFP